jgi:class 3 adenylate cyclase
MSETNDRRRATGEAALGYGLSLHIGSVMFGNVGLPERLSFSVFGSAVNETARLETLTKKFATPIVASKAFTTACGGAWEALGSETLRGLDTPIAVFRPAAQMQPPTPVAAGCRRRDDGASEPVVLLSRDRPAEPKAQRRGRLAKSG